MNIILDLKDVIPELEKMVKYFKNTTIAEDNKESLIRKYDWTMKLFNKEGRMLQLEQQSHYEDVFNGIHESLINYKEDKSIMVKQLIMDVEIPEGTDVEKLIKQVVKEIELKGNKVLTPNDLIIDSDVTEYYIQEDHKELDLDKVEQVYNGAKAMEKEYNSKDNRTMQDIKGLYTDKYILSIWKDETTYSNFEDFLLDIIEQNLANELEDNQ